MLFICSQNRLRSPTAEVLFSKNRDIEVASAGTNHDAEVPLTAELIEWADVIFVMELHAPGKTAETVPQLPEIKKHNLPEYTG